MLFPLQSVVMHMSFDKEAQLLKTKKSLRFRDDLKIRVHGILEISHCGLNLRVVH